MGRVDSLHGFLPRPRRTYSAALIFCMIWAHCLEAAASASVVQIGRRPAANKQERLGSPNQPNHHKHQPNHHQLHRHPTRLREVAWDCPRRESQGRWARPPPTTNNTFAENLARSDSFIRFQARCQVLSTRTPGKEQLYHQAPAGTTTTATATGYYHQHQHTLQQTKPNSHTIGSATWSVVDPGRKGHLDNAGNPMGDLAG